MNALRLLCLLVSFLFYFTSTFSQPVNELVGEYVPPTPNAAAINQYTDIPVSHFTGTPSINIPVYTIQEGPIQVPINLSYHGSGIKVAQMSSWVGLGWNLSSGGSLNRSILDRRDEVSDQGYIYGRAQGIVDSLGENTLAWELMENAVLDKEPDIFYFNFGAYSGKMVYSLKKNNGAGGWFTYPRSDLRVEHSSGLVSFVFTTPEGIKYTFGQSNAVEKTHTHNSSATPTDLYVSSWYLTQISSADSKYNVNFHYVDEEYKYPILSSDQESTSAFHSGNNSCDGTSVDTDLRTLYTHVEGKRLSHITTSSNKVRVDFIATIDREDTEVTHGLNAKRLERIKITSSGTTPYCKEYRFKYSYSNPTASTSHEKRLILNQFDEIVCGSQNNLSGPPPHVFTYTDQNSIPSRLSKRVDHWGYYNGISSNDLRNTLIPNTAYVNFNGSRIYYRGGDPNETADRRTVTSGLRYGSLEKVEYPTGGSTTFEFEPHTEFGTRGATNLNYVVQNVKTECGGSNYTEGDIAFSEHELSSAYCRIKINLTGVGSCDCVMDRYAIQVRAQPNCDLVPTPTLPPPSYYRFNYELSPNEQCNYYYQSDWIPLSDFFTYGQLVAAEDTTYRFFIEPNDQHNASWIKDGKVEFDIKLIPEANQPIGGLRIKSITQNPSIGPSIKTTYSYDDPNSGKSTGVVLVEPRYGYLMTQPDPPQVIIKHFNSTPLVSTADVNGNTFGYRYVREERGGQVSEYFFEAQKQISTGFPVKALPPLYSNGKETQKNIYVNDGTYNLIKQTNQSGEVIPYPPNGSFDKTRKIHSMTCFIDDGELTMYVPSIDITYIPSYYRLTSVVNTVDGMTSADYYAYDLDRKHTNVIEHYMENSDDVSFSTKYYYAPDTLPENHFLNEHNIVSTPLFTIVNEGLAGGSKVEYSNTITPGVILPNKFYALKTDGNWRLDKEILSVNNDGYPTSIKVRQQQLPTNLEWSADPMKKGQLDKIIHGDRVTQYKYKNRLQIDSIINFDGLVTTYEYDNLERLSEMQDRNGNRTVTYDYSYGGIFLSQNWTKTTTSYTPTVGSELVVDRQLTYFDGLGRTYTTVDQAHSPDAKDIIRRITYDSLGRVTKEYEPYESAGSTGALTALPPQTEYTLKTYENSALNRIKTVTPPDWHATTMDYGTNGSNEVYDYANDEFFAENTLSKTTTTDGNGNKKISYTDKRGRIVSSKQVSADDQSVASTDNIYDNRDRLIKVLPPGKVLADSLQIYHFTYDENDLMIKKKIPGRVASEYQYNDKFQLYKSKDGIHEWATYTYDNYDREYQIVYDNRTILFRSFDGLLPIQKGRLNFERIYDMHDYGVTTSYFYDEFGRVDSTSSNHHRCCHGGGFKAALCQADHRFTYDFSDNVLTNRFQYGDCRSNKITTKDSLTYDHSGRLEDAYFAVNGDMQKTSNNSYTLKDELEIKKISATNSGYLQELDYVYLPNGFLISINQSLGAADLPYLNCPVFPGFPENTPNPDLFYMELAYDNELFSGLNSNIRKNGDISQMVWQTRGKPRNAYGFKYDYLNRLTDANFETLNGSGEFYTGTHDKYGVNIGYEDEIGNISNITRKGTDIKEAWCNGGEEIDNLIYHYKSGTSELEDVEDIAAKKDLGFPAYNIQDGQYTYDDNGNMTYDPSRKVSIKYNRLNLPDSMIFDDGKMVVNRYDHQGKKLSQITWMEHRPREVQMIIPDTFAGTTDTIWSSGPINGERRDYIEHIELVDDKIQLVHHSDGRVIRKDAPANAILPDTIELIPGEQIVYYASSLISPSVVVNNGILRFKARDSIKLMNPFNVVEATNVDFEASIEEMPTDTGWQWEYYIKDHLGNIRMSFADLNENGTIEVALYGHNEVLEENHYYPFGMKMGGPWLQRKNLGFLNKYNYNGKEEMPLTGYLYYGARFYDPSIGRFLSIDPLASNYSSWSPFSYTLNNPIRFIDPDGMRVEDRWKGTIGNDGNVSFEKISDEGGNQFDYVDLIDADGNHFATAQLEVETAYSSGVEKSEPGYRRRHGSTPLVLKALPILYGGSVVRALTTIFEGAVGKKPRGPGAKGSKPVRTTFKDILKQVAEQSKSRKAKTHKSKKTKDSKSSGEHTKGARKSTRNKHEEGQTRKLREQEKSTNPNKQKE